MGLSFLLVPDDQIFDRFSMPSVPGRVRMYLITLERLGREDFGKGLRIDRNFLLGRDLPLERCGLEDQPRLRNADQDDARPGVPRNGDHGVEVRDGDPRILSPQHVVAAMTEDDEIRMVGFQNAGKPGESQSRVFPCHALVGHPAPELLRKHGRIALLPAGTRSEGQAVAKGYDNRGRRQHPDFGIAAATSAYREQAEDGHGLGDSQSIPITVCGLGIPEPVRVAVAGISFDVLLDGEAVGETLHAFKLLELDDRDLRQRRCPNRYPELLVIFPTHHPALWRVITVLDAPDKLQLYKKLRRSGREGIVFKDLDAPGRHIATSLPANLIDNASRNRDKYLRNVAAQ